MRFTTVLLTCLFTTAVHGLEVTARLKTFTSVTELPSTDLLNNVVGDTLSDHHIDLRLLFKHQTGAWRLNFEPTLTITAGDAVQIQSVAGLTLDQLPGTDAHRLFDWSDELFKHADHRGVARIDRASLGYRQASWSLQVGRQALSWGNGLVFQPLDLFSPFAPTTVDREFKPGVDALLFESLLGELGEIQALWIGRQSQPNRDADYTGALKWSMGFSQIGVDVIVAQHLGDDFGALSFSTPLGGSMVRIEAASICDNASCTVSGLINLDYTMTIGPALLYTFAELYRNGYGQQDAVEPVSAVLSERLVRGEVFTVMEHYASLGANITWHALWSQSLVLINNLQDQSGLIQTSVNYEPSDASRMQFGVTLPYGADNSEFGKRYVDATDSVTSGGNPSLFVSISYYF